MFFLSTKNNANEILKRVTDSELEQYAFPLIRNNQIKPNQRMTWIYLDNMEKSLKKYHLSRIDR